MSPPLPFCLCADDYAMTPGVSRGILEALEAGALSATSAMTSALTWPDAAPALLTYVGRADIGLHLNLTSGAPLGPMPTLAPRGRLPTIGAILRMAHAGTLPHAEVTDEIGRQMDRFIDVLGRPPDHIDGHQHVHVVSPIRKSLCAALEIRDWRPWLRDCGDRSARILRRRTTLTKAFGLSIVARGWGAQAARLGYATNEGFAGFSTFDPAGEYGRLFTRYLEAPGPRHLIMCHPGYVDDALHRLDPVVESRERELAFLTSTAFARTLERANAVTRRMTELTRMP